MSLQGCIWALKWVLYEWFYFISGYFIIGLWCTFKVSWIFSTFQEVVSRCPLPKFFDEKGALQHCKNCSSTRFTTCNILDIRVQKERNSNSGERGEVNTSTRESPRQLLLACALSAVSVLLFVSSFSLLSVIYSLYCFTGWPCWSETTFCWLDYWRSTILTVSVG